MLSQKESLRHKFLLWLTAAIVLLLLLLLSFAIFYIHTNNRITQNLNNRLDNVAQQLIKESDDRLFHLAESFGVRVSIVAHCEDDGLFEKQERYYLRKSYKYQGVFMTVVMDVTNTKKLEADMLNAIMLLVILTTVAILTYVGYLTNTFLQPIFQLSNKLSDMNENYMKAIDIDNLPEEFKSLGKSINSLVNRIQNYIKYQKELFTGVSHELKTPLAVLKTKNQVVLIKDRDREKYKQTLKENNKIIDEVNSMVTTVLEFGRQESAQFEAAQEIDLMDFFRKKIDNFKVITHDKTIIEKVPEQSLYLEIQPTLLNQIFQNLMQNAIKFAKETITVSIIVHPERVIVEIVDDGEGIEEGIGIFAPFKRSSSSQGIGLGLYLAKSAANAIGAHIDIKNGAKGGAKATIEIDKSPSCKLT